MVHTAFVLGGINTLVHDAFWSCSMARKICPLRVLREAVASLLATAGTLDATRTRLNSLSVFLDTSVIVGSRRTTRRVCILKCRSTLCFEIYIVISIEKDRTCYKGSLASSWGNGIYNLGCRHAKCFRALIKISA